MPTTKIHTQLDNLSRKLRRLGQNSAENQLSSAKVSVLSLVKRHNPVTLKELASLQGVALPTMSKIIDELQKRSLVIRAQSKEDARRRWIVPTQKGMQSLHSAQASSEQFWQEKLAGLTLQQVKQVSESLDILLITLSDD